MPPSAFPEEQRKIVRKSKRRTAVELNTIAKSLDNAQRCAKPIAQLSSKKKGVLSLAYAYRTQARAIALREKRTGVKMGLTSRAKAAQMGVSEPVYGRLTDGMLFQDGGRSSMTTTAIRASSPRSPIF